MLLFYCSLFISAWFFFIPILNAECPVSFNRGQILHNSSGLTLRMFRCKFFFIHTQPLTFTIFKPFSIIIKKNSSIICFTWHSLEIPFSSMPFFLIFSNGEAVGTKINLTDRLKICSMRNRLSYNNAT